MSPRRCRRRADTGLPGRPRATFDPEINQQGRPYEGDSPGDVVPPALRVGNKGRPHDGDRNAGQEHEPAIGAELGCSLGILFFTHGSSLTGVAHASVAHGPVQRGKRPTLVSGTWSGPVASRRRESSEPAARPGQPVICCPDSTAQYASCFSP